jgi:hypothetical protein
VANNPLTNKDVHMIKSSRNPYVFKTHSHKKVESGIKHREKILFPLLANTSMRLRNIHIDP